MIYANQQNSIVKQAKNKIHRIDTHMWQPYMNLHGNFNKKENAFMPFRKPTKKFLWYDKGKKREINSMYLIRTRKKTEGYFFWSHFCQKQKKETLLSDNIEINSWKTMYCKGQGKRLTFFCWNNRKNR